MKNRIQFLSEQIRETRDFTNRLMSEIPKELWFEVPAHTDMNFAWQIGHLIASQNFHCITVIHGRNPRVFERMPIMKYNRSFYGMGTEHRSIEQGIYPASQLQEHLDLIQQITLELLETFPEKKLDDPLEPVPLKHPLATTKYEEFSWSFKHEMWHCAEMELVKRLIGKPIQWV